jgi:rhamnogalacturonan endolyase
MKHERSIIRSAAAVLITTIFHANVAGAEVAGLVERLDRGVVAVQQGDGSVYVTWRVLGYDAPGVAFNVYRQVSGGPAVLVNATPVTGATWLVDKEFAAAKGGTYTVRPVVDGKELAADGSFVVAAGAEARPYLSIPIKAPEGYHANDCSVGDLDGDGRYDIVVHMVGQGQDNSRSGKTTDPIFKAYTLDGKELWTINLGKNIREGAHYSQLMVYDLDGDGRAEVVLKTADGTVDGTGKVIGDASADHRNDGGYVLRGPEYLTVFDGLTGAAVDTVDYIPKRGISTNDPTPDEMKKVWGDGYGNRGDRFLAAVAKLGGTPASVIMCRGYYTRTVLAAFDYKDGKLVSRWTFDSGEGPESNRKFAGQGNHNLSVADVDGDGFDEVVYGGAVIDHDGTGLYSTGLGHGDALHVGDLDPENPGLEMVRIQERFDDAGLHMVDLKSGKVLWRIASTKAATSGGDKGEGPGRGVSFDIDPRYPGHESWAAGAGMTGMYDAKGNKIAPVEQGETVNLSRPSCNFGIWWDGDLLRELLDGGRIDKWDWENAKSNRIFDGKNFGVLANNGTKNNPCLSADILGDWREELILRNEDSTELRIFVSTIPTEHRLVTLMHDPVYRMGVVWQNVAYNQPPHTSYFLGHGMTPPAARKVRPVEPRQATSEVKQ